VLNDVQSIAALCKRLSPRSLVTVDGVCSFGGEPFYFDKWKIDCAMTCSQKALGSPPGLALLMFSPYALSVFEQRVQPVPSYYCNLKNWMPIMQAYASKKPSYFATPNVNLICALGVNLKFLLKIGMEQIFELHRQNARKFRSQLLSVVSDLKFVPTDDKHMANTLSAIYFPHDLKDKEKFVQFAKEKYHVIIAGGLHKEIKPNYFRVGHMGYSVWNDNGRDIEKTTEAIKDLLTANSQAKQADAADETKPKSHY